MNQAPANNSINLFHCNKIFGIVSCSKSLQFFPQLNVNEYLILRIINIFQFFGPNAAMKIKIRLGSGEMRNKNKSTPLGTKNSLNEPQRDNLS